MSQFKALENSVRNALLRSDLSDSEDVEDRLAEIVRNSSDIYIAKNLQGKIQIKTTRIHLPVIIIELMRGSEAICSWTVYLSRVE